MGVSMCHQPMPAKEAAAAGDEERQKGAAEDAGRPRRHGRGERRRPVRGFA